MNRRIFQLLRAWVPSWRFFETLSDQAVLFYRVTNGEGEFVEGEWRMALTRPTRRWYSIILNGEGNQHLACYALLDQFEEDLGDLDVSKIESLPTLPSYTLLQNLVCYLIRERNEMQSGTRYQFKVSRMLMKGSDPFEELFVSQVHSV